MSVSAESSLMVDCRVQSLETQTEINTTFRDEDLDVKCPELLNPVLQYWCAFEANECKQICNGNSRCLIKCGAKLNHCNSYCPLQQQCLNGCSGCKSTHCQCDFGGEVPGSAECEEWDVFFSNQ